MVRGACCTLCDILIIVFIEIKLTIATCCNDTSNKLPCRTALHCVIEHKALARRPSSQPNITQVLARSVRLLLSTRCPQCRNLVTWTILLVLLTDCKRRNPTNTFHWPIIIGKSWLGRYLCAMLGPCIIYLWLTNDGWGDNMHDNGLSTSTFTTKCSKCVLMYKYTN